MDFHFPFNGNKDKVIFLIVLHLSYKSLYLQAQKWIK